MKTLFKSLILSILDYCSPPFHPTLSASTSIEIESIQRAFTRRILNMKELNYRDRLKMLNMRSVERRRERFIIIYMFKILHKLVPNPGIEFKQSNRNGITALVPIVPSGIPCAVKKLKYHHFNFYGPRLFNLLPLDLRNFSPMGHDVVFSFKNKLDQFLSTIPDQPTVYGLQRSATSNSLTDQIYYMT